MKLNVVPLPKNGPLGAIPPNVCCDIKIISPSGDKIKLGEPLSPFTTRFSSGPSAAMEEGLSSA